MPDLLKSMKLVQFNQAALDLFSAKNKKALVTHLPRTHARESNRAIFELFALLMEGRTSVQSELKMNTVDHKSMDVLYKIHVPKPFEDNLKSVIISLEDISVQKKYERHLKRLAQTDLLTAILNHAAIRERVEEEFLRANRYKLDLAVIMFDMDKFKQINDERGHQKGDLILRQTANLIKENLREVDIIGRYGGDEFMAILPETSAKNAFFPAERIRKLFEELSSNTKSAIFSTLSIGIAGFPSKDITSAKELVTLADQAMYMAKKSGRNRIVTL